MMHHMKHMQDKSSEVAEVLSTSVETLSGVTENNSVNNKQIAEKADRAADASRQTLEQIDDVKTNVVNISENLSMLAKGTDEITRLSQDVKELTTKNADQMQDAREGFEKISDSTGKSRQVIYELENKSKEIAKITNVITSISSQTNLLALNASIESARAGEAGRGFAVVADEIRGLAEQTKKAVEEIGTIVSEVTSNTADAAKTMDESNSYISQGMEIIKRAEQSSNQVTAASDEMNGKISEIDLLTKKVAEFAGKIVDIVEHVKDISMESMNELESVSETSRQELSDMGQLEELVVQIRQMAQQLNDVIHD